MPPDPLNKPPNNAAFLSLTEFKVKEEHGGGGCPVIVGKLHSPIV